MIQVFKCDHCDHFTIDAREMIKHENKCKFNPKNKYCYTCNHAYEAGCPISGHEAGCSLNLDCEKFEKEGNCSSWTKFIFD